MDQSSRRQYSPSIPGYGNAVDEATLYGVPRTLAVGVTLAGAGQLYAVPVPPGCNRALVKSKVSTGTGNLIVYHSQTRERSAGDTLAARIATLANTQGDDSAVVQIPPGSGFLTCSVSALGVASLDAEAIFWRESP